MTDKEREKIEKEIEETIKKMHDFSHARISLGEGGAALLRAIFG